MRRDDPRHGTHAGYQARCRERCCQLAISRYNEKRRSYVEAHGHGYAVPSWRALRRIQSLQRLGWSVTVIAERMGVNYRTLYAIKNQDIVTAARFVGIARIYDELSMRIPETTTTRERIAVAKTRNHAERNGWPPPLAWTDIDDQAEQPRDWEYVPTSRADVFAELVERGDGRASVCRVLHISESALERWCERTVGGEVFRMLGDRDRGYVGQRNQYSEEAS